MKHAVLVLLVLLLTGQADPCAPPSTKDEPEEESSGEGKRKPRAGIGDSLTLTGNEEGLKMRVKVLGVRSTSGSSTSRRTRATVSWASASR